MGLWSVRCAPDVPLAGDERAVPHRPALRRPGDPCRGSRRPVDLILTRGIPAGALTPSAVLGCLL